MGEKEVENTCGLGRWRPKFLQECATMRCFTIVYGLLGTVQAMSFVYFIATLTTLEKRFQIRSEITGILMSGNEVSQICLSVILAYKGGKGNRPVWIAWGVLFSSISCFILAVPHFIYGPGKSALALTEELYSWAGGNWSAPMNEDEGGDLRGSLCTAGGRPGGEAEDCRPESTENQLVSLWLIFVSQFLLGVGTTLYMTLGQPYLDDNTKRENTPKLLGMTMALRSAGPAGGFILGFLCLNTYIEPSLTPVIERSDPRWLGAWWLGWIILGTIMTVFSFLMAAFPRQMKRKTVHAADSKIYEAVPTKGSATEPDNSVLQSSSNRRPNADDDGLIAAVKRVATNPLLIFNNFTAVFYILGASGYINFFAKYAEVQYHQSAAFSSMIAGVSTMTSIILGFLGAGFFVSKYKPRESYLLLFNVFIAGAYMAGEFAFLFLTCEDGSQGSQQFDLRIMGNNSCNGKCSCDHIKYSPVCYQEENQSYFSPCHAGCSEIHDPAKRTYSNCSCLPRLTDTVRQGPCATNCTFIFIVFVSVQCLIQLIGCSGRITNVLINYRTVKPKDKPLAQGVCLLMTSLLAFVPGPIVYGRVIDSTCLVWDIKCGYKGNCWVYDKAAFRTYLNVTAMAFTFGAFVCDIVVFYLGRDIKLYEEADADEKS